MGRTRRIFAPILDLLDEGLRLYRRGFTGFMLLTALAALPLGIMAAAFFLAADWLDAGTGVLLVLGAALVGLPLSLYVMGALSRAAGMAAAGEPVRLGKALAIRPLRLLGMGCYGTVFLFVASAAVSTLSTFCFCVVYLLVGVGVFSLASVGAVGGAAGEAAATVSIITSVVALLGVYLASLVVNGAVYGSAVYAMQPFVQDDLRLGAALRRSLDLVTYRFGQNLLAFVSASLVFGAAAVTTTLAIGVLLPLPALFLLGGESPVARAITAAAWVVGISAATPLLPIWMALLYGRRRADRQGEDLEQRIAALGE